MVSIIPMKPIFCNDNLNACLEPSQIKKSEGSNFRRQDKMTSESKTLTF